MERVLCHRYRLIQRIGAGAAATVFRAEDLKLGRDVAVKILSADAEDHGRQQQELAALSKVQHPFLISLLDCGSYQDDLDGPRAFLVMELIEGPNLRSLLTTARRAKAVESASEGLNPDGFAVGWASHRVAKLGWALALALDAVHQAGVVHRDIKPANSFIGSSPNNSACARARWASRTYRSNCGKR